MKVTLCVLLWARPGAEDGLVGYEDQVLDLVPGRGGRRTSLAAQRDQAVARTEVIQVQLVPPSPGQ